MLTANIETLILVVGFEVITAVVMKSSVHRDMALGSPVKVNRRLGGTRRFNFCSAYYLLHPSLLFGLFCPEDGGDVCLRNVAWLSTD
jgi:hypothetical protein